MAPITQETVDGLKDVITKLESRVADLENRLTHGGESSKSLSTSQQMRLILMGPPGAGLLSSTPVTRARTNCSLQIGKGTQAPRIKEKFCVCHLVSPRKL